VGLRPRRRPLVCSPMYHSVSVRFAGAPSWPGHVRHPGPLRGHPGGGRPRGCLRPVPPPPSPPPPHSPGCCPCPAPCRSGSGRSGYWSTPAHRVHRRSNGPPSKWSVPRCCGSSTVDRGQFTVCPTTEWLERPGNRRSGPPGEGAVGGRRRHGLVPSPAFARFAYWRDEAETAAAWRDGAFTVGTSDGSTTTATCSSTGAATTGDHGRRERLPAEVEAALADVPGVIDVAVFGWPTAVGPAGVRRGGDRARHRTGRGGRRPRAPRADHWPATSAPSSTRWSTRCPGRPPARSNGSAAGAARTGVSSRTTRPGRVGARSGPGRAPRASAILDPCTPSTPVPHRHRQPRDR